MTSMALDKANRLLNARVPLLIWGESGTGKTTFARLAALRSFGNGGDLVHVDCATFAVQSAISPSVQRALLRDRACLIVDRLEELDDNGQKALLNFWKTIFILVSARKELSHSRPPTLIR